MPVPIVMRTCCRWHHAPAVLSLSAWCTVSPTQLPEGGMAFPLLRRMTVVLLSLLYKPPGLAQMAPQAEAKIILRPEERTQ